MSVIDSFERPVIPQLTETLLKKASRLKIPISGTFELSPVCNFTCRMCYVRKTKAEVEKSDRPQLTKEQWLELAKQARDSGMIYLLLTGGEPFLWKDFWWLYEKLAKMGFAISINTNGYLIDDEMVARLKENPPRRINITLYGANDATYERLCGIKGAFAKVDEAIHKLQNAGICVKLNCSLTPENENDLEALINYSKENHLVLQVATYMFPPVRRNPDQVGKNERFAPAEAAKNRMRCLELQNGEEKYRKFIQSMSESLVEVPEIAGNCKEDLEGKVRCRAGKAAFWITWDGWMTPCGMMPEPKTDVSDMDFQRAWKDVVHMIKQLTLSGVCQNCENQKVCHACAAMAYAETGKFSGIPKYLCKMAEELKIEANKLKYKED